MKCPHCDIPLLMTERKGVEIDYCSQCRGVWLDRGELDKIIELSVNDVGEGEYNDKRSREDTYNRKQRDYERYQSKHKDGHYEGKRYKHKRKSMLDEIFDIFD